MTAPGASPIEPWRATCVQIDCRFVTGAQDRAAGWEIIATNIEHAVRAIDTVFERGHRDTRLIVIPELAFQGLPMGESVAEWIERACYAVPGEITHPIQAKAREHGIYIGANQFEVDPLWPGRFFNCSYLVDPAGEIVLKYRRVYTAQWPSPHDFLDAYLERHGVEGLFPVAETELGRIALMPCAEVTVPEAARAFMLRGAEVLLHTTNEHPDQRFDLMKPARAAENMMYLVSTNVAVNHFPARGDHEPCGAREPRGGSAIFDYRGRELSSHRSSDESIDVSALIDVEALRAARSDPGMENQLARLRFEAYRPLYRDAVFYPANRFADRPMAHADEALSVTEEALARRARDGW